MTSPSLARPRPFFLTLPLRHAYLITALVVEGWALLVVKRHSWNSDFRIHLATVLEIMRNPWSPVDPLVGAGHGNPYFSPYMAVAGWLGKAGLGARTALELCGLASLAVWLWAVRRFCRHVGDSQWIPVVFVAATFFLWGTDRFAWSGFLGLHSLSWNIAYPSTLGAGLMLLTWDAYLRARTADRPNPWPIGAYLVAVVLIHPFTGVNTVLGLIALIAADPGAAWRALGRAGYWRVVLAAAAAVAVALLWPLSDVLSLLNGSHDFNTIHKPLVSNLWHRYGYALIGVPALIARFRRPLGRELLIMFGLAVSVVTIGALTGSYSLARAIPIVLLPLHLSIAAWVADAKGRRLVGVAVVLVVLALGVRAQASGVARAFVWADAKTLREWRVPSVHSPYTPLLKSLAPGSVAISDDPQAGRALNPHGTFTVAPGWPDPWTDEARRRADSRAFFAAATTPEQRLAIADRYRVSCAVVTTEKGRQVLLDEPRSLPGFAERAQNADGSIVVLCRARP